MYACMYVCMYLGLSIILSITQIRNNNINWNLKIYNYTNYETTTQHSGSVYVCVCWCVSATPHRYPRASQRVAYLLLSDVPHIRPISLEVKSLT